MKINPFSSRIQRLDPERQPTIYFLEDWTKEDWTKGIRYPLDYAEKIILEGESYLGDLGNCMWKPFKHDETKGFYSPRYFTDGGLPILSPIKLRNLSRSGTNPVEIRDILYHMSYDNPLVIGRHIRLLRGLKVPEYQPAIDALFMGLCDKLGKMREEAE